MPFFLTHTKLAVSLKDSLGILNMSEYISGTNYPDSHYMTGVSRELTHPYGEIKKLQDDLSDFKKGWAIHLLADEIWFEVAKERFPKITEDENQLWYHISAIKGIEDLLDVKKFEMTEYLKYFDYIETPNGEDPKMLRGFYLLIRGIYEADYQDSLKLRFDLLKKFNIPEESIKRLKLKVEEYENDEKAMVKIGGLFDIVLQRIKVFL